VDENEFYQNRNIWKPTWRINQYKNKMSKRGCQMPFFIQLFKDKGNSE